MGIFDKLFGEKKKAISPEQFHPTERPLKDTPDLHGLKVGDTIKTEKYGFEVWVLKIDRDHFYDERFAVVWQEYGHDIDERMGTLYLGEVDLNAGLAIEDVRNITDVYEYPLSLWVSTSSIRYEELGFLHRIGARLEPTGFRDEIQTISEAAKKKIDDLKSALKQALERLDIIDTDTASNMLGYINMEWPLEELIGVVNLAVTFSVAEDNTSIVIYNERNESMARVDWVRVAENKYVGRMYPSAEY